MKQRFSLLLHKGPIPREILRGTPVDTSPANVKCAWGINPRTGEPMAYGYYFIKENIYKFSANPNWLYIGPHIRVQYWQFISRHVAGAEFIDRSSGTVYAASTATISNKATEPKHPWEPWLLKIDDCEVTPGGGLIAA